MSGLLHLVNVKVTVKVTWIYIAPSRETSKAPRHGSQFLPANYTSEKRTVRGRSHPCPAKSPPRCTECNSPTIYGQCTNFILFNVALKLPLHCKGLTCFESWVAFLSGYACSGVFRISEGGQSIPSRLLPFPSPPAPFPFPPALSLPFPYTPLPPLEVGPLKPS